MEKGLSNSESIELLKKYGLNEISKKEKTILDRIFSQIISPITLMLIAASVLSLISNKVFDFFFIIFLLIINIAITIFQESKADNAIKKLNNSLDTKVFALRDNQWQQVSSKQIVPGDLAKFKVGDIVVADGKIIDSSNLTLNMSSLTGESIPVEKKKDDNILSGSFISTGVCTVLIEKTGNNTYFGKTVFSVDTDKKKSLLEKDVLSISRFLTILSITCVIILSIVLFLFNKNFLDILELDLSLVIAGIPISLPTVMTLIIEIGVINLAKKNAVIRRLSALEDFSNVDLLLTDKTGTLTKNQLSISEILPVDGKSEKEILKICKLFADQDKEDPINKAILDKVGDLVFEENKSIEIQNFIPADSNRKHSTLNLKNNIETLTYAFGAPQIILSFSNQEKSFIEENIERLSNKGYRVLVLAEFPNLKEENGNIIGIISFSDTLREDAEDVIKFLNDNGVLVKMVSGDNDKVVKDVGEKLPLNGSKYLTHTELQNLSDELLQKDQIDETKAFAEVLPDEKYRIVKSAKQYYMTAATGDGVNDLPALKASDVGIAVSNAVSALKSTADIVLLSPGISVIKDSIIESRKIFKRIYSYSVYRISESFRLVITILILGLISGNYPLTSIQIIMLALLNDIPIISLAFDNVDDIKPTNTIKAKKKFKKSILFGMVGVANSLILYFLILNIFHLSYETLQSIFFLKMTVSGHMLIFVSRTTKLWFKSMPSKYVILATFSTQIISSLIVFTGFLMPAALPIPLILVVWLWAFFWMQISEVMKIFSK